MPYAPDTGAIATPIGMVVVSADRGQLTSVRILPSAEPVYSGSSEIVQLALTQLAGYFAGSRTTFDLPLAPAATRRGAALRQGMIQIGFGETCSYSELAAVLKSGSRAIGQACARNPFPILVPCHRVLASSGLGNYSAGEGILTKHWLLDFERAPIGDLL